MVNSEQSPDDLDISELRQNLREARIDRDGWQTQAELSNTHLNRILRSPAWKLTKPFRILNVIAWRLKPELLNDNQTNWDVQPIGPTVWNQVKDHVFVEANNADLNSSKIAILAQWSQSSVLTLSTNRLIAQLMQNGFEVVVVSACEDAGPIVLDEGILQRISVIRKPNVGYDFGSWSIGLSMFPEIQNANEVLILNDSNSGPFGNIEHLVESMNQSPFDITGVTDSLQHRYHIQSFMMHFKNGSLSHPAMVEFWKTIRSQSSKSEVILAYEIGLTSKAQGNGLFVGAIYPWNILVDYWANPSVNGWKRLLDLGYPFIKREVLRSTSEKGMKDILSRYFDNESEFVTFEKMIKQDSL